MPQGSIGSKCAVLFLLGTVACVHTYDMTPAVGAAPDIVLQRGSSILVGVPGDGSYGHQHYHGSGQTTATELSTALFAHTRNVTIERAAESRDEYVEKAREEGVQYLILPTIAHWEERATEWSGRPDRITIRLDLIEVDSGRVLDTTTVSGKSRWFTFGGDHPQDLLAVPLSRYASRLFGKP